MRLDKKLPEILIKEHLHPTNAIANAGMRVR